MSDRLDFLKRVFLFAVLDDSDLCTLASDLVGRRYDKDDAIFYQGDHSYDLYVVYQGKVRILRLSPSGGETTLNVFSRYGVIGEFAALDDQPRTATARALTDCVLLEMAQEPFLQHMRAMPDLALAVSRLLVRKLHWTTNFAETIAQHDTSGRLLHILLLYNERFGLPIQPGVQYELDLGMNQAELASLVGARREWVSRTLGRWRKRGLIAYHAGKITILDLPAVQAERDRRIEVDLGDTAW